MLHASDQIFKCPGCDNTWDLETLLCRILDIRGYSIPLDQEQNVEDKLNEIRAIITRQAVPGQATPGGPTATDSLRRGVLQDPPNTATDVPRHEYITLDVPAKGATESGSSD